MSQHERTRTLLGSALVLGTTAFSVGDLLRRIVEPADATATAVTAAVRDRPTLWLAAGLLEVLAAVLLVPGAIGTRRLATRRGARTTRIGAGLIVVGAVASMGHTIGYYGTFATYAASGLDAATLDTLVAADDLLGGVVILLFMIGMIVGPVVLAIGLRRAGAVPVWVPVLALVFVVASSVPGPLAGIVGLVAGLGSLGVIGFRVMRADLPAATAVTATPSMA